jgi:hypothetical protein
MRGDDVERLQHNLSLLGLYYGHLNGAFEEKVRAHCAVGGLQIVEVAQRERLGVRDVLVDPGQGSPCGATTWSASSTICPSSVCTTAISTARSRRRPHAVDDQSPALLEGPDRRLQGGVELSGLRAVQVGSSIQGISLVPDSVRSPCPTPLPPPWAAATATAAYGSSGTREIP